MSNLDDFFKKRDKKKKTGQKSKLDIDEFAKKLEQTSQIVNQDYNDDLNEQSTTITQSSDVIVQEDSAPQTVVTAQQTTNTTSSSNNNVDQLDEDWKPFDSDENKDYTGLRINIQNWKIEDQELENDGINDENEKKTNCPWAAAANLKKTLAEAVASKPVVEENKNEEETKQEPSEVETAKPETNTTSATTATSSEATTGSTTTGAYIPPALRRQMQQSQPTTDSQEKSSSTTETTSKYVPPQLRNREAASSTSTSSAIPATSVNYRRPNKSQPNINDTLEFPTLDALAGESSTSSSTTKTSEKLTNGSEKFEMPKKSGNIQPKSTNNMIDLDNKYTALQSSANN